MKVCSKCKQQKPFEEFYFKDKKSGTRQSCCKVCKAEYNKSWYTRNTNKHKKDVSRNVERYYQIKKNLIWDLKSNPCTDCGVSYPPYVMQFDHVRGVKVTDIAKMMSGRSTYTVQDILEELDKCELVCANCHAIRTYNRRA